MTKLVIIVSYSHPRQALPLNHPQPRVLAEDVGCPYIDGWAKATLRLKEDGIDKTYVSSRATLRFKPRSIQDQPGVTQYDVLPTAVTWTASGTEFDCSIAGQAIIHIPNLVNQPPDITRPAQGYMAVIGVDGGDFHSIWVSAADPAARLKKTCPGDPPTITEDGFQSVWLLHVVSQTNTHDSSGVVFKGMQTLDPDRFQDHVHPAARGVLDLPAVKELMSTMRPGRTVYTFEYELRPRTGPLRPP